MSLNLPTCLPACLPTARKVRASEVLLNASRRVRPFEDDPDAEDEHEDEDEDEQSDPSRAQCDTRLGFERLVADDLPSQRLPGAEGAEGAEQRSEELGPGGAARCQARCLARAGCAFFTWWDDGGCHLSSGKAGDAVRRASYARTGCAGGAPAKQKKAKTTKEKKKTKKAEDESALGRAGRAARLAQRAWKRVAAARAAGAAPAALQQLETSAAAADGEEREAAQEAAGEAADATPAAEPFACHRFSTADQERMDGLMRQWNAQTVAPAAPPSEAAVAEQHARAMKAVCEAGAEGGADPATPGYMPLRVFKQGGDAAKRGCGSCWCCADNAARKRASRRQRAERAGWRAAAAAKAKEARVGLRRRERKARAARAAARAETGAGTGGKGKAGAANATAAGRADSAAAFSARLERRTGGRALLPVVPTPC
jgi:hypothetical protein